MTKEFLNRSIMLAVFTSLLISMLTPAFAQDANALPRKTAWTADSAPKEKVIQIAPKTTTDNEIKDSVIPTGESAYANDRIIVKYKPGFTSPAKSILSSSDLKNSVKLSSIDAEAVKLSTPTNVELLIAKLNNDPNVLYAQPDHKLYKASSSTPDDTYFSEQWALLNTGQDPDSFNHPGLPGLDIKATEAWEITKGSSDLIVAVIDTGLPVDHPDLVNNIWNNTDEFENNTTDDDRNGYINDVHGWNFADNNNQLYNAVDNDSHGTIIAGIIAASTNNGIGVAGIAPNVKIMPLKYITAEYGYESDLIKAIAYAEKNGAKIANVSSVMDSPTLALKAAIDASSMLFVTAAGNSGANADTTPAYPAAFDSPNILSVAAVDNTGNMAGNFGYETVDVAAPGLDIVSTFPTMNPGLSAEIDNGTYKAVFNGIAFENILDDEDADANYRQDAFDKAMDYLGASKDNSSAKILLVQDDLSNNIVLTPGSSKLSKYTALLEDYAGFDEEEDIVQSTPDGGDGPLLEKMKDYDVVIWFTGIAARENIKNLTDNDQLNLTSYLNGKGHLLLTGSHSLINIEDSSFVSDVLHLYFKEEFMWENVVGVPGTLYEGVDYPLDEDKDSYNWVISRDPKITKINLEFIMPFPKSNYTYAASTSYAAAHASGVAALVLSKEPSLTALAVKQRIMNSGTRLSSLAGRVASGRMINAYQALLDDEIPGTPFFGNSVTNNLNETSDTNDVYSLDLLAGDNLSLSMTGDAALDSDLYLYSPAATTVNSTDGIVASSENVATSTESIKYTVPKSGTYYINAYAFKGSGNYTINLTTDSNKGTTEDTSSSIVFSGPWAQLQNAAYSGSSMKQINSSGIVEFPFLGSYISWIGSKNDQQGMADVYIDGIKMTSPSLFSKSPLNKQIIFEKMVPYGQHTLKIEWTGKLDPNAKKTGTTFINVDAFTVSHLIQENNALVTVKGAWLPNYSLKNLAGIAKYTNIKDSYVQFKFEGTKVQLLATTAANRGKANIYIDDKLVTAVDMYSATSKFRAVVFESATLSPGNHTIKVVNAGEKNASSSGTYISVDAISIIQ